MPQRTGNADGRKSRLKAATGEPQVIDFSQVRAQKLEEKRRKTERIFFRHLLSVYSVTGGSAMHPVEIINVSEDGCAFQVPYRAENPWPNDTKDIPLRFYFSQDTYLEIRIEIVNSTPSIEDNSRYVRYGCKVDTTTGSYPAYLQFVRFLKAYSEQAHKDKGGVTLFYL